MKPNVVTLRTQQRCDVRASGKETKTIGGAHVAVVDLAQRADLVRQRLDLRLLVRAHRLGRVDGGAGARDLGHLDDHLEVQLARAVAHRRPDGDREDQAERSLGDLDRRRDAALPEAEPHECDLRSLHRQRDNWGSREIALRLLPQLVRVVGTEVLLVRPLLQQRGDLLPVLVLGELRRILLGQVPARQPEEGDGGGVDALVAVEAELEQVAHHVEVAEVAGEAEGVVAEQLQLLVHVARPLEQLQPGLQLDLLAGLDREEGAHLGRVAEDGERGGGELRLGLDVLRDVLCARGFVCQFACRAVCGWGRGLRTEGCGEAELVDGVHRPPDAGSRQLISDLLACAPVRVVAFALARLRREAA